MAYQSIDTDKLAKALEDALTRHARVLAKGILEKAQKELEIGLMEYVTDFAFSVSARHDISDPLRGAKIHLVFNGVDALKETKEK